MTIIDFLEIKALSFEFEMKPMSTVHVFYFSIVVLQKKTTNSYSAPMPGCTVWNLTMWCCTYTKIYLNEDTEDDKNIEQSRWNRKYTL